MKLSLHLHGYITIFAIFQATAGLKCYVCRYASDPSQGTESDKDCESSPLPERLLKECSEAIPTPPGGNNATFYCMKRYIESKGEDKYNINRDCAVKEDGETSLKCEKLQMGDDLKGSLCHCETEGCNGTSERSLSFALIFFVIFSPFLQALI